MVYADSDRTVNASNSGDRSDDPGVWAHRTNERRAQIDFLIERVQ